MATGIIGTIASAGSLSYTPQSNAKMTVVAGAAYAVSVNGQIVTAAAASSSATIYVGANQTATITTPANGTAMVSAIEENS